jgi:PAS domain S-box-containing protein
MAEHKDQPDKYGDRKEPEGESFRLRLRGSPEAIILVTRSNRIILSGNTSLDMEDFSRKEILEIQAPGVFESTGSGGMEAQPSDLAVELIVGKTGALAAGAASFSRKTSRPPAEAEPLWDIRSALEASSADAVLVTRADGTICSWNAGAEQMYGYPAEEVMGKQAAMLIPVEQAAIEQRLRDRVLAGEAVSPCDLTRITKKGVLVDITASLAVLRDKSGAAAALLEIDRSIMERVALAKELSAKVAALTQSNQELQEYSVVVAHDLQAPLNTMATYFADLSYKCMNFIDPDTMDRLTRAAEGVQRMQELIKSLLELARLDSPAISFTRVDCSAILEKVLANLNAAIRNSGALIQADPLPEIMADPTQIGQVFQNLISNAIKFSGKQPPEIRISAEIRAGEWRFAVKDNGIGIDQAMQSKVFQPLQRAHRGDTYRGSGLGLAIVKKIITRHGGRIWVDSAPGAGSIFYFTIPATEQANES